MPFQPVRGYLDLELRRLLFTVDHWPVTRRCLIKGSAQGTRAMKILQSYIFIEFNALDRSATKYHVCPQELPTKFETELIKLFCCVAGDPMRQP